jgi:hypothetical protein
MKALGLAARRNWNGRCIPFALRKADPSYALGVFVVHVAVPSSKKEMRQMASIHRFSACYACGIAALAFSVAAPLLAQSQGRGGGSPRYDLATETTLTGAVESVEQITTPEGGRGRRGLGGTHITLKTSAETLEVHLGPTAFLNEKKVTIAKGDTLVVVGSRVAVDGDRVFIAKEVKKGDSVWTLRDAAGLPLWRGRGGQK